MTSGNDGDVLAAALIQLAAHAEQITGLDHREASHHQDTTSQLGRLSERADNTSSRIDAIVSILSHHACIVNALDGLDHQVASIARQIAALTASNEPGSQSYQPAPAPRWWQLADAEREPAIDRLRAWVDQIYRPGYDHLAAALPRCWELHPLCLYTLDWLSELWSALYLEPKRPASTLAAQAEWQTRILPAAADQMAHAAASCQHAPGNLRPPPRGPFPGPGPAPGRY